MNPKVSKFIWQEAYSVGDEAIDGQHRRILDILNLLHDLLHSDATGETLHDGLREVFWELHTYVIDHFADEERRMEEADYPDDELSAHRSEHDRLIRKVMDFEDAIGSGDSAAIAAILPFIYGDWLIAHICGSDRRYAPYLQRAG